MLAPQSYSKNDILKRYPFIKDGKNFKRSITRFLDATDYKYEYKNKKITILEEPPLTTWFKELFIIELGYSYNTNWKLLTAILKAVDNCRKNDFDTMPYLTKLKFLKEEYDVETTEQELRTQLKRLQNFGIIYKEDKPYQAIWYTYYDKNKVKIQKKVNTEEEYNKYLEYKDSVKQYMHNGHSLYKAIVYTYLDFEKAFYTMASRNFLLNFINEDIYQRNMVIYSLVRYL